MASKGSVEVSECTLHLSLTARKSQQKSGVGGEAGGGAGGGAGEGADGGAGEATVTICGFKESTHDDTIRDYIQNKRVAGSKSIKAFTRSGSAATVTFHDPAGWYC